MTATINDYIESIGTRCRDCYRCLRECPVKAIALEPGDKPHEMHARVIAERCILDGRCVQVCPQKAKRVRSELPEVKRMLAGPQPVAVSLAPSFPSALAGNPLAIPGALRRLGFAWVQETAVGAEMVAAEHQRLAHESDRPLLTSSCPAIVNLIECHYPAAIPFLAPVVSPMVAHGRYLKRLLPDHKVVFIGPCIAKKHEAKTEDVSDAIDAVLTFEELVAWLAEENIDLNTIEPESFDGISPGWARLFAVDGGTLRTAELSTDMLSPRTMAVSGIDRCKSMIEHVISGREHLPVLIELLSCEGGCIAGPTNPSTEDTYLRRERVLDYARQRQRQSAIDHDQQRERLGGAEAGITIVREYVDREVKMPEPDEASLRAILAKSGKHTPEDELNCGACGYDSCREKAKAVYWGWADPEMCIPYMRQRAESMSATIVDSTPNAIFVASPDQTILDINPSAERMFKIKRAEAIGRKLGDFLETSVFAKVVNSRELLRIDGSFPDLELDTRQTWFWEEEQGVVIVILADCTDEKRHLRRVTEMREETLDKAQGVINKQMEVAQKIAGLLGETTAETKVLLSRLMKVMRESNGDAK